MHVDVHVMKLYSLPQHNKVNSDTNLTDFVWFDDQNLRSSSVNAGTNTCGQINFESKRPQTVLLTAKLRAAFMCDS